MYWIAANLSSLQEIGQVVKLAIGNGEEDSC